MKKILILLICLMAAKKSIIAQPMTSIIRQQAMLMSKAMSEMDIKQYASFTYPTLAEAGKEVINAKASLDSINKYRKMFGIEVKKIVIGDVSAIVTHKKIMQATLPQTIILKTAMGEIETQTTLVALSNNNGKTWYFVDANLFSNKNSKAKLPELSPQISIPKMEIKNVNNPK